MPFEGTKTFLSLFSISSVVGFLAGFESRYLLWRLPPLAAILPSLLLLLAPHLHPLLLLLLLVGFCHGLWRISGGWCVSSYRSLLCLFSLCFDYLSHLFSLSILSSDSWNVCFSCIFFFYIYCVDWLVLHMIQSAKFDLVLVKDDWKWQLKGGNVKNDAFFSFFCYLSQ